jgi:hypothetical protein
MVIIGSRAMTEREKELEKRVADLIHVRNIVYDLLTNCQPWDYLGYCVFCDGRKSHKFDCKWEEARKALLVE